MTRARNRAPAGVAGHRQCARRSGPGRVEEQAHRSAVGGIPLSVVGVGGAVDLAAIDRLTLAGQGNRRLLANPSEAPSVVDRELHLASR